MMSSSTEYFYEILGVLLLGVKNVKKKDPRLIIMRIPVKNDKFLLCTVHAPAIKRRHRQYSYYTVEVYSKTQL